MMFSTLTSVLFGASVVLANAIPGHSTSQIVDAIAAVDITYTGPITPGGKNYTLYGDAKASLPSRLKLYRGFAIITLRCQAHTFLRSSTTKSWPSTPLTTSSTSTFPFPKPPTSSPSAAQYVSTSIIPPIPRT
ncbi:hypothetical protein V496_09647 [Pseudogymnoascus sp. VKM F-4515 (FW-2607)]|nr:hypothetical protein V496_09647 [Pseudogymnoascus sp. VKM F-4515 (FW-2607)]